MNTVAMRMHILVIIGIRVKKIVLLLFGFIDLRQRGLCGITFEYSLVCFLRGRSTRTWSVW